MCLCVCVLPETVRPYPKAGPRKASGQRRRKRASDILNDTPVKNALEKEKKKGKSYYNNNNKKGWEKAKKKNTEDTQCLVCDEWFSTSQPRDQWKISCSICGMWLHVECTDGGQNYICHHCK